MPTDPVNFAREFCERAKALAEPIRQGMVPGTSLEMPPIDPVPTKGSIFISYEHTDRAAAVRIAQKLQARGCKVWLDVLRFHCGHPVHHVLERAVLKECEFFVSVISHTTETRRSGYFLQERNWAAERLGQMNKHLSDYYYPVIVDDTPLPPKNEPRDFWRLSAEAPQFHAERAMNGEISDELVTDLYEAQSKLSLA